MVEEGRLRCMGQKSLQPGVVEMRLNGRGSEAADGFLRGLGGDVEGKMALLLLRLAGVEAKIAVAELVGHHVVNGVLLRGDDDVDQPLLTPPAEGAELPPECVRERKLRGRRTDAEETNRQRGPPEEMLGLVQREEVRRIGVEASIGVERVADLSNRK